VRTVKKSIHLELSSDLTTETFLLAPRGPVHEMHSDCGTNFVGESRLLTPLEVFKKSTIFSRSGTSTFGENG